MTNCRERRYFFDFRCREVFELSVFSDFRLGFLLTDRAIYKICKQINRPILSVFALAQVVNVSLAASSLLKVLAPETVGFTFLS